MYILFVDSSNSVSFDPEWDYEEDDKKIENRHRTRSGKEFVYKWGDYRRRKFSVSFVDSSTAAIVNSWWNSNTPLLFMREGDTDITSCYLIGRDKPLGKFVKPYDNLYKGVIELGEY